MIVEIFSTGDEVLTGAVVDSNAAYIAERLVEAEIEVTRHTCVGDDIETLVDTLGEISLRADMAIMTGGLGPTSDDLTASAVAKAAGVNLAFDQEAFDSIERFFAARNFSMRPSDKKQAMIPSGSEVIPNPVGTAPGFVKKIGQCTFFCLPGVPWEMKEMMSESVQPMIEKRFVQAAEKRVIRVLGLFGLPEAAAGEKLNGIFDNLPDVRLGFRAKFPEIHIRLYAKAEDESKSNALLDQAAGLVMERVGKWIFSKNGEPMEEVVGGLLKQKKATVAVAESCTGGLISHMLTNVPGSSDYFLFSGTTYSNKAKTDILGVSPRIIEEYGAVSEETAKEMAAGVRKITGADYGLATSGIAGPTGERPGKPVGTICIGVAAPDQLKTRKLQLSFGSRSKNKAIFAMAALELLRRELQEK